MESVSSYLELGRDDVDGGGDDDVVVVGVMVAGDVAAVAPTYDSVDVAHS